MKPYLIEIELRAIDQHGDAIDVLGHYRTLQEARKNIPELSGESVAWVIERRTSYGACSGQPDNYELLDVGGDQSALHAGGWTK